MQPLPGPKLSGQWYGLLGGSQTAISPSHQSQDVRPRWTQGCSDSPMSDLPERAAICSTMALGRSGAILDKSTVSPCEGVLERGEVQKSIDCTTSYKALLFQIQSGPCNLTRVLGQCSCFWAGKADPSMLSCACDEFSRGFSPCAIARRERLSLEKISGMVHATMECLANATTWLVQRHTCLPIYRVQVE
ncbi:hypothetical protein ACJQWK_06844 [Exserohilum turcicum]